MDIKKLREEYIILTPRLELLRESLSSQLRHALQDKNITLGVPIEARVKQWDSIEEKISRKAIDISSVTDFDDLVGIRIILLFRSDLLHTESILLDRLSVLRMEDTGLRLEDAKFGYQSKHYIAELRNEWLLIPTMSNLGGLRAEIQVRTLAQHIWAVASHKLQYKREQSVPIPLRRSLYRASALLETVDLEFDRFLEERQHYVTEEIPKVSDGSDLNVDNMAAALDKILPLQNKAKEGENYDEILADLLHFGIDTTAKLTAMLGRHLTDVLAYDAGYGKDSFFFRHIGLVREALRREFGEQAVDDYVGISEEFPDEPWEDSED